MNEKEKEVVREINHPCYTVEFLEEWIYRNDNVFVNAPAALEAMGAKGFYAAVEMLAKNRKTKEELREKLKKYEDICIYPEKLKEISGLFLEKCQEVNRLKKELETQNDRWIPCSLAMPPVETDVFIPVNMMPCVRNGNIQELIPPEECNDSDNNVFLIGFKDLLASLRLLEKMGEIPEIGDKWWLRMATLYGNDILMVEFKETE